MLTKAQIQLLQALQQKKNRQHEQLFIAEGTKIVAEILQSDYSIHSIYATQNWVTLNEANETLIGLPVYVISESELSKISSLTTPNEVLCAVKIIPPIFDFNELSSKLSLALDDIQDPGNFGTIIRIADWFGIETILCSAHTVDVYNSKVIQATMGSFLRTKIIYCDLQETISAALKTNINVYATVIAGENVYKSNLSKEGIIVLGNESKGISENLLKLIPTKLTIPAFGKRETDSLNVSIAAAILCSEFKRLQ